MMGGDETSAVHDQKSILRREAVHRREQAFLDDKIQGHTAGARLRTAFLAQYAWPSPLIIAGYMPRETELNVLPLLEALHDQGHALVLPMIEARAQPLRFRAWRQGDPLRPGVGGIPEPFSSASLLDPDVLLVPLLAYDARLYRLGYGGGYYDRTLAALRQKKNILAIGIAYAEQQVPLLPHTSHDQPLDAILAISAKDRL